MANLVLHGIDQPNLWHGNTLTRRATYGALFDNAPKTFEVILTNPPFGGKEGKDAQAKADEIDAAVFDLKAVNPNVVTKLDDRTPDEIIRNIETQGKIVANALNTLKALLQGDVNF